MTEQEIRLSILEQLYEYHWREAMIGARLIQFARDHYTYRDMERAHHIAAEWAAREHMGILRYEESTRRMKAIQQKVLAEHKQLVAEGKIAQ